MIYYTLEFYAISNYAPLFRLRYQTLLLENQISGGIPFFLKTPYSKDGETLLIEEINAESGLIIADNTVAFPAAKHGNVVSAFQGFNSDNKGATSHFLFIRTTDGTVHMFRDHQHVWSREEGLIDVASLDVVDFPVRAVADASARVSDDFGFNKMLVVSTKFGKVYGMNTEQRGNVTWSRLYRLENGYRIHAIVSLSKRTFRPSPIFVLYEKVNKSV